MRAVDRWDEQDETRRMAARISTIGAALLETNDPDELRRISDGDIELARAVLERSVAVQAYPAPEDFGLAAASPLAEEEYVTDVVRPGRITVVAAEEDSGKTFAIPIETGVRLALGLGSFAGTWAIKQQTGVLYLSQMHPDDDIGRLDTACASLGVRRDELRGRYWRLSIFTAANGRPVLADPEWRTFIVARCRETGTTVIIFDTGTDATDVHPWGQEIAGVYRDLRAMIADYPELAIVILVHLKKPQGRGQRRISDVLGEWGRLNDITLLMESVGTDQTKLSLLKRTNRRTIVATKRGGLLVDPTEPTAAGPKVPLDQFVAAIAAEPGKDSAYWAIRFEVTDRTVQRYAQEAGDRIRIDQIKLQGNAKRSIYYPKDDDNGGTGRHTLLSPSPSPSAGDGDGFAATVDSAYIESAVLSSPSSSPSVEKSPVIEPSLATVRCELCGETFPSATSAAHHVAMGRCQPAQQEVIP